MIANQGFVLTSSNLFGKTQYKSRKDLWVVRCSGITCWIGRGDIVSHLLGIQGTNSQGVYRTHTHDLQGMPRLRTRLTKVQQTLGLSKHKSDGTP